ncbi:hypothetical protein GCM10007304_38940 [Rhodococcoides trifolii]|uniref:Secreted protein n=1 Tax=Rhodococcoides trifolii TaxID=908250 RepID=A0A917G4D1_9NOCA|nr:hypothetical protein GCM10007304_38940 [Rhodococcus trifolii]
MTATWFGLAVIALLGAVALLYVDRTRRRRSGKVRQIWAKAQGYRYTDADHDLPTRWNRAVLANQEFLGAVDVVEGVRRGEEFVLFDLEDTVTVVAVRREVGSDVDLDLRLRSTPPPKDADMNLLGSLGPRIIFSTDLDVARRVCDQRMVAFTHSVPDVVQMLWSEREWTLGTLAVGSTGRDWDAAIDTVTRLSGLLHVLPPASRRPAPDVDPSDDADDAPRRPVSAFRRGSGESRVEPPPRQDASSRQDSPSRQDPQGRSDSSARSEAQSRVEPPSRMDPPARVDPSRRPPPPRVERSARTPGAARPAERPGPPAPRVTPISSDRRRPRADSPRADSPRADGPRSDGPRADGPRSIEDFRDRSEPIRGRRRPPESD